MSDNIDAQRLQEAMEAFVQTLHNGSSGVETEAKRQARIQAELNETQKRLDDEFNKMYNATSKVTTGMTGMMKSIKDGGGSFSVLNNVVDVATKVVSGLAGAIPVLGGALKALGEAAGDVTKMMIDQYQQSWTAYKDIANVGIADSFEHTKDIVFNTGLTFNELSKTLKPSSKALSNWSGTVSGGTKAYQQVSRDLENVRRDFNALGVSATEFSEMQLKFMEQEGRMGRQNQRNLTSNTQEYIEKLTTLSKLTGMQTKDMQAARDQAMSETRFRSRLDALNKEQQEALHDMNAMIQQSSPELAQGFRDLVAAGGVATTDAARTLVQQTGGQAIVEVRKMLGKSNPNMNDVLTGLNNLKDAAGKSYKNLRGVAQYAGDANVTLQGLGKNRDFATSARYMASDVDKVRKGMKANVDGTNAQTKALSETEMNLRDASIKMSLFATNVGFVNTAMEAMSDGIDAIAEKMFELSGQEMPADFKARREEREAIRELNEIKKKELVVDKEVLEQKERIQKLEAQIAEEKDPRKKRTLEAQLANARRSLADYEGGPGKEAKAEAEEKIRKAQERATAATAKRREVSGQTPQEVRAEIQKSQQSATGGTAGGAPATPAPTAPKSAPAPAAPAGEDGQGKKDKSKDASAQADKVSQILRDEKALQALFSFAGGISGNFDNFKRLDEDMKKRLVSAALDYQDQGGGKLRINAGARSYDEQVKIASGPRGKWAAPPGTSPHEKGLAVDIQNYNDNKAIDALTKYGLTNQKVAGEPWHFQKISAREGFEGFVEGPQEGYKPDIELHGREKVKIEKEGENSTAELIKTFKELMTAMLEKQDDMLEHLETSAYNSEKLVRAAV